MLQQAAKVAISCSYRIFNARQSPSWDIIELLAIDNCIVLRLSVCVLVCVCFFLDSMYLPCWGF